MVHNLVGHRQQHVSSEVFEWIKFKGQFSETGLDKGHHLNL